MPVIEFSSWPSYTEGVASAVNVLNPKEVNVC